MLPRTFLVLATSWILLILSAVTVQAEEADLESAICHVCRVHEGEAEPEPVVATADHEGQRYGFCSTACRDRFVEAPQDYVPPVLPRPAPAFEAVSLDGETISSKAVLGQWTLLDFWATWCKPCVDDLPRLSALHERYGDRGFAVVGISIDEGRRAAKKVRRMIKKQKATHPIYLDSESAPAWAGFGVRVVPSQFLISPEGQIVAQWSGTTDLEAVAAAVAQALGDG